MAVPLSPVRRIMISEKKMGQCGIGVDRNWCSILGKPDPDMSYPVEFVCSSSVWGILVSDSACWDRHHVKALPVAVTTTQGSPRNAEECQTGFPKNGNLISIEAPLLQLLVTAMHVQTSHVKTSPYLSYPKMPGYWMALSDLDLPASQKANEMELVDRKSQFLYAGKQGKLLVLCGDPFGRCFEQEQQLGSILGNLIIRSCESGPLNLA